MQRSTLNPNRTFGVEIEFFGVRYDRVIEALTAEGIDVKHESYNHTTRRHWKLVYDSSVNKTGTGNSEGGHELVSPILKGKEGLAELGRVLAILTAIGAKVDKTCGFHVHHGANDLNLDGFKNLFAMYYKFEKWIDMLVPPSRRGNFNRYCKSIEQTQIDQMAAATTMNQLGGIFQSRYIKLNFQSFWVHGTIEFRQHGGTLEPNKGIQWVTFTQAMVERAMEQKIRVTHDRDAVDLDKQERRFRRMIFGDYKAGCLDNEYGQAFVFQTERRQHFQSRVA
ncbi:hypothetical protein GTO91_03075 [Heliobacterium undosum]|uniref:Amidoligase enzyme n=1 Tax=Heliomicrobium undosum TaxID=121734 RepID=A0A845L718_9FIRM|nr:amidoligase family protein [Heliomicrobium undosum]MZP28701.1 hypothetical protein [Heliomicrobium undosum]